MTELNVKNLLESFISDIEFLESLDEEDLKENIENIKYKIISFYDMVKGTF